MSWGSPRQRVVVTGGEEGCLSVEALLSSGGFSDGGSRLATRCCRCLAFWCCFWASGVGFEIKGNRLFSIRFIPSGRVRDLRFVGFDFSGAGPR